MKNISNLFFRYDQLHHVQFSTLQQRTSKLKDLSYVFPKKLVEIHIIN